jgi:hypothetical protein
MNLKDYYTKSWHSKITQSEITNFNKVLFRKSKSIEVRGEQLKNGYIYFEDIEDGKVIATYYYNKNGTMSPTGTF